jgi:hypothetical protein
VAEYYWWGFGLYIIFADGLFFYAEKLEVERKELLEEFRGSLLSSKIAFIPPVFVFELTVRTYLTTHKQPPTDRYSLYQSSKLPSMFSFFTISRELCVSSVIEGDRQ